MFKTANQVKKFIEWCKVNNVQSVELPNFKLILSPYANLTTEDLSQPISEARQTEQASLIDSGASTAKEDEEVLYWSAR